MTEITPANARAPSPQDHSQDLSVISASLSTTSETRKRQRRREGNSAVSVTSWWVSVPHRYSTSQVDRGRDKVTNQRRLTRRLPRCTRSLNMCKTEASKDCQTDWAHAGALDDEHVDLPDVPEVTDAHMERTTLRVGGKPVARGKEHFNVYLDVATVAYFQAQAGGRGHQTLISKRSNRASLGAIWRPPCAAPSEKR